MIPSWARQAVEIVPARWETIRGKRVAVYDQADAFTVRGCHVEDGASMSDRQFRDGVTIRYTAFLPPGVEVDRHAKVTYDGDEYRIDAKPYRYQSPTGAVSHTVLYLIDWEG